MYGREMDNLFENCNSPDCFLVIVYVFLFSSGNQMNSLSHIPYLNTIHDWEVLQVPREADDELKID